MNLFLLLIRKNARADVPELDELERYVPIGGAEAREYRLQSGNVVLQRFQLYPELYATPSYHQLGDQFILFDGYPNDPEQKDKGDGYAEELLRGCIADRKRLGMLNGEYVLVYSDGRFLHVTSNPGGSHQLFWVEHHDFVAFSNRLAFLLATPGVSHEMDEQATQWLCYQGYTQNQRTPYKAIRKVQPGTCIRIDLENHKINERSPLYRDLIDESVREDFARNPLQPFRGLLRDFSGYLQGLHDNLLTNGFHVPLSGGKDSRLIIALLCQGGLKDRVEKVWTKGPHFSPDVIAAKDVMGVIKGIEHEIRIPPLPNPKAFSLTPIILNIGLSEGNTSLFNIFGLPRTRDFISVAGHQNALRDGFYTECSTSSLKAYLADVPKHHMHDPLRLLAKHRRKQFTRQYAEIFQRYHEEEKVPLSDLSDYYMLRERNGNWVSMACHIDRYIGPVTNPLLLPQVFKLAFNIPASFRSTEAIHYVLLHLASPNLLDIPFANKNAWKTESLNRVFEENKIPLRARKIAPYRTYTSFPDFSNPFISNLKVQYFLTLQPAIKHLMGKHREYFENIVDKTAVETVLHSETRFGFLKMLSAMALFSNVLLIEYGLELFERQKVKDIACELEAHAADRVAVFNSGVDEDGQTEKKAVRKLVEDHQLCIEDLVRRMRERPKPTKDVR